MLDLSKEKLAEVGVEQVKFHELIEGNPIIVSAILRLQSKTVSLDQAKIGHIIKEGGSHSLVFYDESYFF